MPNLRTFLAFLNHFKDEETCIRYLERKRWEGNPLCPFCGAGNPYITNRGFKCSNNQCYRKFTVTTGTIYTNSKIKLRKWFITIYLCRSTDNAVGSTYLSRELGTTQKSAWHILQKAKRMLAENAPYMLQDIFVHNYQSIIQTNVMNREKLPPYTDEEEQRAIEISKTPKDGWSTLLNNWIRNGNAPRNYSTLWQKVNGMWKKRERDRIGKARSRASQKERTNSTLPDITVSEKEIRFPIKSMHIERSAEGFEFVVSV